MLSKDQYPGLLFVLSDFLVEGGGIEGLKALQSAGHEVNVIHMPCPGGSSPRTGADWGPAAEGY